MTTASVMILSLWSGDSAADAPQALPPDALLVTHVRLTDSRIEYSGLITAQANAGVVDLYENARPQPTTLLIESVGGGADAGIQLGSWLFERKLDVEVETFCYSSCANYVFPAGRIRKLARHASLMWHGGVTQPLTTKQMEQILDHTLAGMEESERQALERHPRAELLRQLERSRIELVARETAFFDMIGVDQRITTLGHLYERQLLEGAHEHFVGWDYSLDDLAQLGIRNVFVEKDDPWEPVAPVSSARIYRIDLSALPGFTPRLPARAPTVDLSRAGPR